MTEATVTLDILSDPICPWCFIGKSNLDRALAAVPDHPFVVQWHPFQLNPDMPPEGMDRRAYLEAKFGGQEGAVKAYLPVAEKAREAGIEINFEAMQRTPNTLDAHRLIHWAGLEGRQAAMVSALFRAYFVDGRDIGDRAVLTEIAGACGLDATLIARLLESDADVAEIRTRDAEIRERGLRGVPGFLIGRTYVVSGAQPTDFWVDLIDELATLA